MFNGVAIWCDGARFKIRFKTRNGVSQNTWRPAVRRNTPLASVSVRMQTIHMICLSHEAGDGAALQVFVIQTGVAVLVCTTESGLERLT